MTYCGCRTRSNRLKWAIAILATIVGLVLIAAAIGKTATDLKDYDDCLKNCQNTGQITASQYDEYKDGPDWNSREDDYADTGIPCVDNCQQKKLKDNVNTIGGLFWGGVAALVIASIPCYIMCCCTPRPDIVHGHAVAVPYSGSAPVATPYQATGPQYQVAQPNAHTYPPSATADPYASAAPPGYPTNQPAYNYGKV